MSIELLGLVSNKKNDNIIKGTENIILKNINQNLIWNDTSTWSKSNTTTSNKANSVTNRTTSLGNTIVNTTNTNTSVAETTDISITTKQAIDIETNLVPFMRAKRITFKASGLKPNSALIALFDNEDITDLCFQSSHSINANKTFLYANGAGQVEGYFDLPDNRFKAGAKIFKLIDSTNAKISSAETIYTSSGANINITTINHEHTETTIQKTTTVTTSGTSTIIAPAAPVWRDPVAQSFFVDTVETNRGVYIHSIDLYFDTVDIEHDILVQVRKMTNGYPSIELVYPYAWSKLEGNKINKSKNSSLSSRFKFETPLFLPSNEEYCFVVMTNSEKSTIWCSEMGQKSFKDTDKDLPTGEIISKQPYLGSMFISQNNTTWDAEQNKDIKFRINRCKFKSNTGSIRCINSTKNDITQLPNVRRLTPNSLEFTENSKEVRIYAHGHGMIPGDKFRLILLDTTLINDIFGIPLTKISDTVLTVKASPNSQNGISATQIIFDVDFPLGANASGSGGGTDIIIDGWNIAYSYAELIKDDLQVDNTQVSYFLSGKSQLQYSNQPSGHHQIATSDIVDLNEVYVIKDDEDGGVTLDIEMKSIDSFVSPMVNVNNIGVQTHLNIVNNIDYLDIDNVKQLDSSPAKYIQKQVNLINPANELKVMFETSMAFNTRVSVYYKVGNTQIDDTKEWQKLMPDEGKLLYSDAPDIYRTQKFTKAFGNSYWNVFKIMIVMQSDDRRVGPIIKNYRALALDSGPTE